jgi:hypothetical protein
MQFKPSAAAGGSANILGVYNAYNRVRVTATERDSTTGWTYATTTWRKSDNNANNSISWMDGLQQSAVLAYTQQVASSGTAGDGASVGIDLDSTSNTPNIIGTTYSGVAGYLFTTSAAETFAPQLGFHYVQGMEIRAVGGTATFQPTAGQYALTLAIDD